MAILKCKMCGGDLNIEAGMTVAECEYCGTKQTVPSVDNEKKLTLFGRANRLRFACEFDKAAGVYETIVADFPEEAEAYWGLVLCAYGIEYVDDPATGKKIPTCHRSSFDSVMDDSNFEQALENADATARAIYREEAKAIEELRKGIIEVSSREEPYDIFICYKETDEKGDRTIDSVIAQDVYEALTDKGYRVFFSRITLEDKLGQEYEPYIFAALNSAKVMLAFGTDYEYYNTVWVKNEWSRFLQLMTKDKSKHLIPCYKGIDAYDMPKEFAKLQAQDMGKVGAIQDLLRGIEKLLPRETQKEVVKETVVMGAAANTAPLLKRAFMFLEEGKWKEADEYCERVLDINPENAEAYLGKLMAELQVSKRENLANCNDTFEESDNYQKVVRFGNAELVAELKGYIAQANIRTENARMEREREVEARRKQSEENAKRVKKILKIAFPIIGVALACVIILNTVIIPNRKDNDSIDTSLKNIEIGDEFILGKFEQDNVDSNGKEDIEWLVLDKVEERILIISKDGLDAQRYFSSSSTNCTWATSTLRKWLNNDFINNAFSESEKAKILVTNITIDRTPDDSFWSNTDTQDKIFLLNDTEVNKYFASDNERQCEATAYAAANGVYIGEGNTCCWWLRSPGKVFKWAGSINYDGSINPNGSDVGNDTIAVRPSMWIDLSGNANGSSVVDATSKEEVAVGNADKANTGELSVSMWINQNRDSTVHMSSISLSTIDSWERDWPYTHLVINGPNEQTFSLKEKIIGANGILYESGYRSYRGEYNQSRQLHGYDFVTGTLIHQVIDENNNVVAEVSTEIVP